MKISVKWLNQYLEPGNVTAEEAEHALTFAGFPIETTEKIEGGDTCLDVEVTSNRGDVLCHVGVAREIAAATGRALKVPVGDAVLEWGGRGGGTGGAGSRPSSGAGGPQEASVAACSVDNRIPDLCRLFTAQVIRGVRVGPSPKWLVEALAAVGQRSINNVVDVTNFVALEYGQPSHVFDLATIAPNAAGRPELIVRIAGKGETLKLLDGKAVRLAGDEMVVADHGAGGRAISLAGVMGGADTEVTERTSDVVLEAATWEPTAVRRAARRFNIRTDASYRFERIVDARTIDAAAARAAALIVRLAGGVLMPGVVRAGPGGAWAGGGGGGIRLRGERITQMLGVSVPADRVVSILNGLGIGCSATDGGWMCTVPPFRPDLTREIDLIEEVARVHGLDKLPVSEKIASRVSPPQTSERAMSELARVLTGLGFYEALTFTFVSEKAARPFVPTGMATIAVSQERRKADPVLRPSVLPSLLACRRANQDAGVGGDGAGGVRLYETSAVFAQTPAPGKGGRGAATERRNLALLADAVLPEGGKAFDRRQGAVRLMRGAVEAVVSAMGGAEAAATLRFDAFAGGKPAVGAFDPAASGAITLGGRPLGLFGMIAEPVQREYDLQAPVCAAEVGLDELLALYPPRSLVRALPQFPSIERDLSLVVTETTAWAELDALVAGVRDAGALPQMEEFWFVTTYRGQPLAAGKKSVTLRMRFRDPADKRTLRHEEVDPQVMGLVSAAKEKLGAELRA